MKCPQKRRDKKLAQGFGKLLVDLANLEDKKIIILDPHHTECGGGTYLQVPIIYETIPGNKDTKCTMSSKRREDRHVSDAPDSQDG